MKYFKLKYFINENQFTDDPVYIYKLKKMSRIGKSPVSFNDKVDVKVNWNTIIIKGPLWELSFDFSQNVKVEVSGNEIICIPINEKSSAIWGTTRSIINNMVEWVTKWFKKSLEINWVGYKFEVQGQKIILSIGYSHKVEMAIPAWLKVELDDKAKNILHVSGIDKQLVWEFAAKIRSKKKPEPYKGKWIKYVWEHIIRKAGKTGAK